MDARALRIDGAVVFTPRQFADDRGLFLEWYTGAAFHDALGHPLTVAQANNSVSRRNTLRGVHSVQPLDPALGLPWPAGVDPVISARDATAPTLAEAAANGTLPSYSTCIARYDLLRTSGQ